MLCAARATSAQKRHVQDRRQLRGGGSFTAGSNGMPRGTHEGTGGVRRVDGAGTNPKNSSICVSMVRRSSPAELANFNSLFSFEIVVTSRCASRLVSKECSVTSGLPASHRGNGTRPAMRMLAVFGDIASSSTRSPIRATRSTSSGCDGSAATSIQATSTPRPWLRPCIASARRGPAGHQPANGADPRSSVDGYRKMPPPGF